MVLVPSTSTTSISMQMCEGGDMQSVEVMFILFDTLNISVTHVVFVMLEISAHVL